MVIYNFYDFLIERVFCNLIENAAKYSTLGAAIEISARSLGAAVEISICDRGSGLPPGRDLDIFAMFVRGVHESAVPGVGLGLAICRSIVEAHGGMIAAEDRSGGGACFTFTLPKGTPPAIECEESLADRQS